MPKIYIRYRILVITFLENFMAINWNLNKDILFHAFSLLRWQELLIVERVSTSWQSIAHHFLARLNEGEKLQAFRKAVEKGQVSVVGLLLTEARGGFREAHVEDALIEAAGKGHLSVVRFILSQESNNISFCAKGTALWVAVNWGLLPMVQLLLKMEHQAISPFAKGEALRLAARHGYFFIVQEILYQVSPTITAKDKDEAYKAASQGLHFVVQALLLSYKYEEQLASLKNSMQQIAQFGLRPLTCLYKMRSTVPPLAPNSPISAPLPEQLRINRLMR